MPSVELDEDVESEVQKREIHRMIPHCVRPLSLGLKISPENVSIDMESYTGVILAVEAVPIQLDGDSLVVLMVNQFTGLKPTTLLAIPKIENKEQGSCVVMVSHVVPNELHYSHTYQQQGQSKEAKGKREDSQQHNVCTRYLLDVIVNVKSDRDVITDDAPVVEQYTI